MVVVYCGGGYMQSCMCVRNHVPVGGCVYVCVHVYLVLSGVVCNLTCVVHWMWLYIMI